MTLIRLAIFAAIVVAIAVLAPKFAPGLIAGIGGGGEPAAVSESVASPPRIALSRQVALGADRRGHFLTEARINGRPVEVMVDTGASIVALDEETARDLGISPARSAYTGSIGTANGTVRVAPVTLSEVRLGDVVVRNVQAAVVPGDVLNVNLLGMSFLNRLSGFEIEKGELILTQ